MRRRRGAAIAVASVILAVLAVRFAARPRPVEVEAARVETGTVEDIVANSEGGDVRSRARAQLSAERAGRVAAIRWREGARVQRGDVLLSLDVSTAETQLQAAERDRDAARAAVEVARAREALAQLTRDRSRSLREQGLVSAEQLDEARSVHEAAAGERRGAEARLAGAESAVRLADDELAHQVVRAPFAGVIARRFVEVGEAVVPGQTVLELVNLGRLYVSAPIDERDMGRVRQGLPARVTLDAYPGVTWPGVVGRVAPVLDTQREQNRTLEVEVELPSDPLRPPPRPGMTADVEIVLQRREGVLRIPTLALIEGKGVLVVERDRAAARAVETGLRNWQWTEVRAGLAPGERVITSLDRAGLKAGAAVRVTGGGPAALPDTGATATLREIPAVPTREAAGMPEAPATARVP